LLASPPLDLYTHDELIKEGKNMTVPVLGFFFPLTRKKNNMINEDVKEKVNEIMDDMGHLPFLFFYFIDLSCTTSNFLR
jgi:hypothetical protein